MLTSFRYSRFQWLWFSNLACAAGRWTLVLVLRLQLLQMTHSSFWVGLGLFLTQGLGRPLGTCSGAAKKAVRFARPSFAWRCGVQKGTSRGRGALAGSHSAKPSD